MFVLKRIGYLKLYRELFDKPIWLESTPEQKVILIALLSMANYEGNSWVHNGKLYKVDQGQFITSIPSIIKRCGKGISEQNVRTSLKRFAKLGFLTDTPVVLNSNRLITIVNWKNYQSRKTKNLTNELTGELTEVLTDIQSFETLDSKGIDTLLDKNLTNELTDGLTDELNPIKEVKEIKNNNMSIQQAELFDHWWNLYGKKIGRKKCEMKFRKLIKIYEYTVIEEGTKRYLQYLNDLKKRGDFVPSQRNPLTFLNGEHFNDDYGFNTVNQEGKGQYNSTKKDEFSGIRLD